MPMGRWWVTSGGEERALLVEQCACNLISSTLSPRLPSEARFESGVARHKSYIQLASPAMQP